MNKFIYKTAQRKRGINYNTAIADDREEQVNLEH